jgi:transposase
MAQDAANTIAGLPVQATPTAVNPTAVNPPIAALSLDAPLPDDLETLKRMIRELLVLLRERDRNLSGVQHRLDQLLRRLYGPKGEKFRADQPALFALLGELVEAPPAPTTPSVETKPAAKKKGHGRRPLPADLRRERVVHDVSEADKVCSCCQTPRVKIGEEISEQLDYQPSKLFVWQHVRLKYACPTCLKASSTPESASAASESATESAIEPSVVMDSTVIETTSVESAAIELADSTAIEPPASSATTAPPATVESPSPSPIVVAAKPAQPIDKGLPGPGLLAFVITSKYADHLPLHRQEGIIGRLGVDIARSTLCDWMAACADLLRPLYAAMLADVLLSRVVQIDETRLPVQEKGNDKTKSGRLWTVVGDRDHPNTVYFYTATKVRDGPATILKDYKGFMQADAANVFDGIYLPGVIVEVGCMAHSRRYFHDARTSDAARAAEALARIGFFYDVEREAKAIIEEQELDNNAADALRLKMRQERTLPKLKEFKLWLEEQAKVVLPKSPIAQAINYARNHWEALLRFTEHGFLNIDNNAAERALRPGAVGRKNWLFAGSDEGGRTTAVLYSLTQTCRRQGIDPFAYLQEVLARVPKSEYQELSDLFPHHWAEAQRAKAEKPG